MALLQILKFRFFNAETLTEICNKILNITFNLIKATYARKKTYFYKIFMLNIMYIPAFLTSMYIQARETPTNDTDLLKVLNINLNSHM